MDPITNSLQVYLRNVNLHFDTEIINYGKRDEYETVTIINALITEAKISTSFFVKIKPPTSSIYISVQPFLVIDYKNINNLKVLQNNWDENGNLTKLNFREEGGLEIGRWITLQLYFNFFSDAIGLTRMLWSRYFECLFNETNQICKSINNIENKVDVTDSSL